ncbi:ABC transporter permease [bacterium]|nr:MAG: ABC transporter permease [bacterium]
MRLTDIALLNLRRRKAKAAFLLTGLLIGVTTVVALLSITEAMSRNVNDKLERYGANILVLPKSETLSLTYGGISLGGVSFDMKELKEEDLAKIRTIENSANIAALGPTVLGVAELSGQKVLTAGVDFSVSHVLKPWWKLVGDIPAGAGVVAGSEAARVFFLIPGETVKIAGKDLKVTGVLEPTGSQDDQLLFTDLKTAQEIFGKKGTVSLVEVAALCKDCPVSDMVNQIGRIIPDANVMAIQSVVKSRLETIEHLRRFSYGISAVVLFVGGLMVLVTMMGSVRERTAEIGVFRAIGFRKSHVMRIIFTESAIVSLLAGILGYPAGLAVTAVALPFFAPGEGAGVALDPVLALFAVSISLLLGLVASIYPAVAATRMDPNEALRAL